MNFEQRIKVCIGTDQSDNVRVRLSLLLVDEAGREIADPHFHSANIGPGDDLKAVRARLEADLASGWIKGMKWPPIPDDQWGDVEAHVAIVQKRAVTA